MTLTYQLGDKLYLNITNRCCCDCVFCIRQEHEGVGDGENLWLERDPTAQEIIAEIGTRDLTRFSEIVFCGFGEPLMSLDVFLEVARYLRKTAPELPLRVNTNGLADLIHRRPVAPLLEGLMDTVSISLNAPTPEQYQAVTRPIYGEKAFGAMLDFAVACKAHVPRVLLSVVNVLEAEELERSRELARSLDISLRVREKS